MTRSPGAKEARKQRGPTSQRKPREGGPRSGSQPSQEAKGTRPRRRPKAAKGPGQRSHGCQEAKLPGAKGSQGEAKERKPMMPRTKEAKDAKTGSPERAKEAKEAALLPLCGPRMAIACMI
jgi:hypothetical protein